jgi:NADH:ubiquinone oxidoreductase subunit K
MIRLPLILIFSAVLFSAGVYGVLARRNAVMVLMAIELMLNAVNVNLVGFSATLKDVTGQVFVAYGPMVVLASAPAIEKRFDASGPSWTVADLDGALGSYFADRDPAQGFVASAFYELS